MQIGWPGGRSYGFVSLGLWGLFLFALYALIWAQAAGWPNAALWAIALTPAVTVAIQFWFAWRTIAAQDEVVRALTAKRLMVAAAVTITLIVAWSPLEEFMGLPHAPAWLAYPLFWGALGVTSPFIQGTRA